MTSLDEVPRLVEQLNDIVRRLEQLFPGRRFTLDGHLVGSVGEVVAASMFDLDLLPASNQGHDARARDGRLVQVKLTQCAQVGLRCCPQHLVVLAMNKNGRFSIPFNGPGQPAWDAAGPTQTNGQRSLSLAKLRRLDVDVDPKQRLSIVRPWTMLDLALP